jgi:hypothetical protein
MKIDKGYALIFLGMVISLLIVWTIAGAVPIPQIGQAPAFLSWGEMISTVALVIVAVPVIFQLHSRFFQNRNSIVFLW